VPTEKRSSRMTASREKTPSDASSFDALASGLAGASISRRRALQLAGASLLAAVGISGSAQPAQASPADDRRRAANPTCPFDTGCKARCQGTSSVCFCIRTTGGSRTCVHPCCSDRTCRRSRQCRRGEVCIASDCCNGRRVCVPRCDRRRPSYCTQEPRRRRRRRRRGGRRGGRRGFRTRSAGSDWG
jgi:hypothetical protein